MKKDFSSLSPRQREVVSAAHVLTTIDILPSVKAVTYEIEGDLNDGEEFKKAWSRTKAIIDSLRKKDLWPWSLDGHPNGPVKIGGIPKANGSIESPPKTNSVVVEKDEVQSQPLQYSQEEKELAVTTASSLCGFSYDNLRRVWPEVRNLLNVLLD